jgi:hypothetical protein
MSFFHDCNENVLDMDVIKVGETHDESLYHVLMDSPNEVTCMADSDSDTFMSTEEGTSSMLQPGLMYGENGRPQLITSGDACMDLYGTWVPSCDTDSVNDKLQLAWGENDLLTLKTIFHKGNTRDGGCGDYLNFIRAYLWLFRTHPKTALENVKYISKNSSLQTLLLITKFLMYDPEQDLVENMFNLTPWDLKNSQLETHKISTGMRFPRQKGTDHHSEHSKTFAKMGRLDKKASNFRKYRQWRHIVHVREFIDKKRPGCTLDEIYKVRELLPVRAGTRTLEQPKALYEWVDQDTKQEWLEFVKHKNATAQAEAKLIRTERLQKTRHGIAHFIEEHPDNIITKMVIAVRNIFVDGMLMELHEMLTQHPNSTACNGLFHKWAPTRGGSIDTATNLGYMIQQELSRRISVVCPPSHKSIQDSLCDHIPRLATMTRKMKYERILRMMRKRSFIPESFVGTKQFHSVDYAYMPGKCLSVYGKRIFKKNDSDRYVAYFKKIGVKLEEALQSGDTNTIKVAAKSVKVDSTETHTILRQAMQSYKRVKNKLDLATIENNVDSITIEDEESESTVLKLQFINLLSQFMSNKKSNGSCWIPVVDTSGSMSSVRDKNILAKPIDVAITLGILVSMTNDPLSKWFCRMVTFDAKPDIYHIMHGVEDRDDDLQEDIGEPETDMQDHEKNQLEIKLDTAMKTGVKDITGIIDLLNQDTFVLGKIVSGVHNMPWGGNTDLVAVFKKQLEPLMQAQTRKHLSIHDENVLRDRIANENMIIFTDMQFDDSGYSHTYTPGQLHPPAQLEPDTNGPIVSKHGLLIMEEITKMYIECGIDKVPKIVFWNLNAVVGAPSGAGVAGVTMVTGFSAEMLKFFLDDNLDGYDPMEYIALQLGNEVYSDLIVRD